MKHSAKINPNLQLLYSSYSDTLFLGGGGGGGVVVLSVINILTLDICLLQLPVKSSCLYCKKTIYHLKSVHFAP